MERKVKLELSVSEFNMIVDKLEWMGCIVRDSNLDYTAYCNGECNSECNRPDLHGFEEWFKSKIVD